MKGKLLDRAEGSRKGLQGHQVKPNHSEQVVMATLKGKAKVDLIESLSRSLVCESNEPRDLETLFKILVVGDCLKILALSKFKFIITYSTAEQMEEAFKNHGRLDDWF